MLDNSLVFFPRGVTQEVEPVRLRDGDFRASRFTLTFWCREDETWLRPDGTGLRQLTTLPEVMTDAGGTLTAEFVGPFAYPGVGSPSKEIAPTS